jgi:hypothetical protein
MCTVVTRWTPGTPVEILAIRDEFVSREFDDPGPWWPEQPTVIGGRDRRAGGSWCVSDVRTGLTALVLNRIERQVGTPSRGVLPLAAVAAGPSWPDQLDYRDMASFTLVLAAPDAVTAWSWDAAELVRQPAVARDRHRAATGRRPDRARRAARVRDGHVRDGVRPAHLVSAGHLAHRVLAHAVAHRHLGPRALAVSGQRRKSSRDCCQIRTSAAAARPVTSV